MRNNTYFKNQRIINKNNRIIIIKYIAKNNKFGHY